MKQIRIIILIILCCSVLTAWAKNNINTNNTVTTNPTPSESIEINTNDDLNGYKDISNDGQYLL